MPFTELGLKYRNSNFFRKPDSFEEVDKAFDGKKDKPIRIPSKDAVELGIYDSHALGVFSPFDAFFEECDEPFDIPTVFILRFHNGKTYLINTEGYDYCRYVMPCEVY